MTKDLIFGCSSNFVLDDTSKSRPVVITTPPGCSGIHNVRTAEGQRQPEATDAFAKGCFCWVSVTIDIVIGGRADASDVSTASGLVGKMPPSGGVFFSDTAQY